MAPSVAALFSAARVTSGGARAPVQPVDVFVEGLDAYPSLQPGHLLLHFGSSVKRTRIAQDGAGKHVAFVRFGTSEEAVAALRLNGQPCHLIKGASAPLSVRLVIDNAPDSPSMKGVGIY